MTQYVQRSCIPRYTQHLGYLSWIQHTVGDSAVRRPYVYGKDEFTTVAFVWIELQHAG